MNVSNVLAKKKVCMKEGKYKFSFYFGAKPQKF